VRFIFYNQYLFKHVHLPDCISQYPFRGDAVASGAGS
jgi:hypothetical protein